MSVRTTIRTILVASVLLGAPVALGREMSPTDWPLERIVSNLEQRIASSPDDVELHYNLGRAHGFAFALERSSLWTIDTRVGPLLKDLDEQRSRTKRAADGERAWYAPEALELPPPTPEKLLVHLSQGVQHLGRALELERESSAPLEVDVRIELCLAWLLDTGAHLASRVETCALFDLGVVDTSEEDIASVRQALLDIRRAADQPRALRELEPRFLTKMVRYYGERRVSSSADEQAAIDALLEGYWIEQAIEHYRGVVERSLAGMTTVRDENYMVLVREARDSLLRLVQSRGYRDDVEQEGLAALQARVTEVEGLKSGGRFVSPILLSLDSCKPLDELVTPDLAVPFDLDGDAVDELWPWIAPGTGWLVWDPRHSGEITSGLQLFGTASAWLFFRDGYRVLDALDDDGNGELRGAELLGIAVWFDRDSDGVSDRGEVVPAAALGIAALATEATERIGRSLGNPCGLEMADGRVLPTYDWVLSPADAP